MLQSACFVAVALSLVSTVASAVLAIPKSTVPSPVDHHSTIVWRTLEKKATSTCGIVSSDYDIVASVPVEMFDATTSCLQWIVLTNTINRKSMLVQTIGSSGLKNTLSTTVATWRFLQGDETNMTTISWRLASSKEADLVVANLIRKAQEATGPATSALSQTGRVEPSTSDIARKTSIEAAPPMTTSYSHSEPTSTYQAPSVTPAAQAIASKPSTSGTYSGIATYFTQDGGEGSCGVYNQDSTYLVAVQQAMMDSSLCGRHVKITRTSTGASIQAIVADTCPGCPTRESLDLSTGAFNALGHPDEGTFAMSWSFV